ncbi:hypothetical protein ASE65_00405 [Sphingomonas sp. Leaf16]|nr:hypothetical protein ASE65_00405 [Sphingomonas sp. Leaf16]KQN16681.1 hypothetical protein ASE81_16470 [Sphingomonas sp. Leaf29]KQN23411.1 hypothetical protein ASE83_02665 [Sphingomonas sp. Leaf32]
MGLKLYFAPFAAVALLGLAACSGNTAAENAAADNAVVETNLTSLDEPLANDTAFGNDIALPGDNVVLNEAAVNAADPVANAAGL